MYRLSGLQRQSSCSLHASNTRRGFALLSERSRIHSFPLPRLNARCLPSGDGDGAVSPTSDLATRSMLNEIAPAQREGSESRSLEPAREAEAPDGDVVGSAPGGSGRRRRTWSASPPGSFACAGSAVSSAAGPVAALVVAGVAAAAVPVACS